ncbi:hypothetical protein RJ55_02881 [Drechmeria coniospora]|nr:hypothetical protein RJ55_02881 [Drechmeria coniospora]
MFGGFAPPQQSPEEIRAMEAEATFTVQQVVATAFMLYLSAKEPGASCIMHHPILLDSERQARAAVDLETRGGRAIARLHGEGGSRTRLDGHPGR